ncbi:MAG: S-methyl-5-thioribose-1-phosphate isomerase [Methylophilaceae bacterium]|nr:S-methyl-5-thioribose-1-phosphate isomerase [Methylophilaceae bacterium]
MKIRGFHYRTIWPSTDASAIEIIDQTLLPHAFEIKRLSSVSEVAQAIKTMQVRGAPLIGAAAAYGVTLAMQESGDDDRLQQVGRILIATRPTAVNLRWAVERMTSRLQALPKARRAEAAWLEAAAICDEDVAANKALGEHGLAMLKTMHEKLGRPLNILTHCNAGWLATVDWGTALAPIYAASDAGIPLHVWVDETRPRNQGASLTAWELGQHGVPHTVIADNAGGHLMQHGQVDVAIVGADRVTCTGDVCNKIGTYLKALAAHDNGVPFYAAVPSPTIDWTLSDGLRQIPIEERDAEEVAWMQGRLENGTMGRINILPEGSRAANPAFDVTPARLMTGIITERGICAPDQLRSLFPA